MPDEFTLPLGAEVTAADRAELDAMRAQFRQLSQEKRGLEGNRAFMDSGHLHATYPEPLRLTTYHAENVLIEKVEAGSGMNSQCVMLHCHGGGYAVGSTLSHRPLAARLSDATQRAVFTFNYRLAPEHRFPAALEDAVTVYRWLLQQFPAQAIVVSGDSAGGSLALALLLAAREQQLPQPLAAVGLSPWIDLACDGNTFLLNKQRDPAGNRGGLLMMAHAYAGKDQLRHPLVSPLYATDLNGLCPLLLQVGTAETLLDDSRRFADKARHDGVAVTLQEWPEMIHVWHSFFDRLPQAAAALSAIQAWLHTLPAHNTTVISPTTA